VIVWGIAGFAAFQLAPAMGLAPELPGTLAADLGARQVWWWGTVASTAIGLGLLGYGRGLVTTAIAVVLLVAPHVIGAPELEGFSGVAPPEVAAAFGSASWRRPCGWALMGWVGFVWAKALTDRLTVITTATPDRGPQHQKDRNDHPFLIVSAPAT
jgi:cobalt transporter subunit CbtA